MRFRPTKEECVVLLVIVLVFLTVRFSPNVLTELLPEPEQLGLLPAPAFAQGADGPDLADIAERSVSSVVNISSEKVIHTSGSESYGPFFSDPFFRQFFGQQFRSPQVPTERRERSLGSGVVVSRDGLILTNFHVVDQADEVRVTLSDGRESAAEVVGADPETDVAVVRLKEDIGDLEPMDFGDSDHLRLGDVVLAIGNPFGIGQTVTMGIVSAKGRANVGIVDYEDFIQTDAAINPGNSGGALVNSRGELVGINTAIISRSGGYQGIGFAIPSNMAHVVMQSLLENGQVSRGWLGVVIQEVTGDLASALGLQSGEGVLVSDVAEDSPADKAGLKRGDVILRVGDEPVDSPGHLRNLVALSGAGTTLELSVLRDGRKKAVEVVLSENLAASETSTLDGHYGVFGGLTVGPLDQENREKFGIRHGLEEGVVVTEVAPGSAAAGAGFRPGDVIREIDRKPVRSVQELSKLYDNAGKTVAVLIQRGRNTFFLALRKTA